MPRRADPLLAIVAVLAFAAAAQTQSLPVAKSSSRPGPEADFKFEVLSIKPISREAAGSLGISKPTPNGFSARLLLYQAVVFAYGPPYPFWMPTLAFTDVRNLPNWYGEVYAFDARVSPADLKAWQSQGKNYDLLRAALRAALHERFKLVLHKEPKQQPTLELVIAKGGPRLKAADSQATLPKGIALEGGGVETGIDNGRSGWNFYGATMQDLTNFFGFVYYEAPVRDRTGLTGRYDFTLRRDPSVPPVATANQLDALNLSDLGLKLKPGTENRPVLVIDHVEKPTGN